MNDIKEMNDEAVRFEGLECWHVIAQDLGYIGQKELDEVYEHANKTAKMISGMIKYLRSAKFSEQAKRTR